MINEEQKKRRLTGIFSSDSARINTGESVEVYLEKLGEREPADLSEMQFVKLGNIIEAAALQAYIAKTGRNVVTSPDTLRHPRYDWLGAHLDAIDPQDGVVIEAKSVGSYNQRHWGDAGTDEIPDRVMFQVQHQLAVTGLDSAHLPVAFATEENLTRFITTQTVEVEVYIIHRSKVIIEHLISNADAVWSAVQQRIPPAPATVADARLLYASETPGAIEATPIIAAMVEARKDLDRRQAQLEHEIDEVTTTLMGYMKEATDLRYSGATLATWRRAKDAEVIDVKRLRQQMPAIADQFTIARPGSRRFLVK